MFPALGCLNFTKTSSIAIYSVEGLPFPLIKCILEACSADTLVRLEQTSPVRPLSRLTMLQSLTEIQTIQSETNGKPAA